MKAKLLMVGGIAVVVIVVVALLKSGKLKDVPGVGKYLVI